MPRLQELRSFCWVIDDKSFTQAARRLGVSQPAVSQQIKSLETAYNTQLLHRHGPQIVPTDAGKLVYEFACQIVSLYDQSHQRLSDLREEIQGVLAVGASSGPGENLLPVLMGAFKRLHPEAMLSLRVGDSAAIIEQVLNQRLKIKRPPLWRPFYLWEIMNPG